MHIRYNNGAQYYEYLVSTGPEVWAELPLNMVKTNQINVFTAGNRAIDITSNVPVLDFNEQDQGLDLKRWRFAVDAQTFILQTVNDAYNSTVDMFTVSRAGLITLKSAGLVAQFGRALFAPVSEPYAIGLGYNNTQAPVSRMYMGVTNDGGTSASNALQISDIDGTAILQITNKNNVSGLGLLDLLKGQIRFPSTKNASSGANVLDDYEEGTFTPHLEFGLSETATYAVQFGAYVVIGGFVFFAIRLQLTARGAATGNATISGFPFAERDGVATGGGVAIFYGNFTGLTQHPCGYIQGTTMQLVQGTTNLDKTNFQDTSDIILIGGYRT